MASYTVTGEGGWVAGFAVTVLQLYDTRANCRSKDFLTCKLKALLHCGESIASSICERCVSGVVKY